MASDITNTSLTNASMMTAPLATVSMTVVLSISATKAKASAPERDDAHEQRQQRRGRRAAKTWTSNATTATSSMAAADSSAVTIAEACGPQGRPRPARCSAEPLEHAPVVRERDRDGRRREGRHGDREREQAGRGELREGDAVDGPVACRQADEQQEDERQRHGEERRDRCASELPVAAAELTGDQAQRRSPFRSGHRPRHRDVSHRRSSPRPAH
jgi:hypothetical protein